MRFTMNPSLPGMLTSTSCAFPVRVGFLGCLTCRCREWTPDSKTPRMKFLMSASLTGITSFHKHVN